MNARLFASFMLRLSVASWNATPTAFASFIDLRILSCCSAAAAAGGGAVAASGRKPTKSWRSCAASTTASWGGAGAAWGPGDGLTPAWGPRAWGFACPNASAGLPLGDGTCANI